MWGRCPLLKKILACSLIILVFLAGCARREWVDVGKHKVCVTSSDADVSVSVKKDVFSVKKDGKLVVTFRVVESGKASSDDLFVFPINDELTCVAEPEQSVDDLNVLDALDFAYK